MVQARSKAELDDLRAAFRSQADQAFEAMFGSDGQNGLVTFRAREDRACAETDRLARWLMEKHVGKDEAGASSGEATCPICGGPVHEATAEAAEGERREFHTRRGKIEYRRAACRCPRCRRIFFPPG